MFYHFSILSKSPVPGPDFCKKSGPGSGLLSKINAGDLIFMRIPGPGPFFVKNPFRGLDFRQKSGPGIRFLTKIKSPDKSFDKKLVPGPSF